MASVDAAIVALEGTQRRDVADDDEIVTVKKKSTQSSKAPEHKPEVIANGASKRFNCCSSVVDILFGILSDHLLEIKFLGMRRSGASLLIR